MLLRRLGQIALAITVFLLILLGLLMGFDFGVLRPTLERRLSASTGRTVRIGAMRRLDHGFHPTIRIEDVRVAQPQWAGAGDMVRVRSALVRLRLWPLLVGRVVPESVDVDGLRVAFVRFDGARANWKGLPSGGGGAALANLTIRDGWMTLDDRKRDHHLAAKIMADGASFRLAGTGRLGRSPSRIALTGPALTRAGVWPFRLDYRSPVVALTMNGRADEPLDLGHFSAEASASGTDLAYLDQLIEAGLPGTQPFRLRVKVVHRRPDWRIEQLTGRIGRSDIAVMMDVRKRDGRTILDGDFTSRGLDFDDLASDAGLARAAAKRAALGPRLIPDTAIRLDHMQRTDGVLRFDFARLLFRAPSAIRSLKGTLRLDHGVLTAAPLAAQLTSGRMLGRVEVRHRAGLPLFAADLRLTGGRLESLFAQDRASGPLAARLRLVGRGDTIRAAVARASGNVSLVVQGGTINRRAALFLGTDAGRALFEGDKATTGLRCLIARFDVRGGTARPAPLLLDTDVARIEGTGLIDLSTEGVLLGLTGQPKLDHAVRLEAPLQVGGVLADPHIIPPKVEKGVGAALKLLGRAIAGGETVRVADADCRGLAAKALD